VKQAGKDAIDADFTRYTPAAGIPALREAVAARVKEDTGVQITSSQAVITNGAKQAIASTLLALLDDGDEVIIPTPCYASYHDLTRLAGGNPVSLACKPEDGFRIDPATLREMITPRTKAVLINTPNNPSGAAYTPDEIDALGHELARHDVWVISDEIYEKLRYDGVEHRSLFAHPALQGRVVMIHGVSKYYAMTGWRMGWAVGPLEPASAVAKIQSQVTGSPSSVSQKAALTALVEPDDECREMVDVFAKRCELMAGLLRDIPDLPFHTPEGAFYLFPDVTSYLGKRTPDGKTITNSFEMCKYLLESHHLALVPGSAFFAEGHIRLSFAASERELEGGVARLAKGLNALQ
jgi:aspartate aminotransferase